MLGEGESASRPSSLVLEAPAPEREPLHFDVQLIGAPPEVEQLVNNIKQVAEDFLYHWKTFPIVLPPSRFSGPGNKLSDIIIPPPCDELDTAALDTGVEPELLSPKQLQSIREKGEFEVPSRLFPGQTHVWRVAGWLQRGRSRAREHFLKHVARAAALVVVIARDRILSDGPVSLRASFQALKEGLYRLLDLLIGMPSMEARDLEKKIREERSRYLVAELICKPEHVEDVSAVAAWVARSVRRADKAGAGVGGGAGGGRPRVPAHYSTPQRTAVDLRLYRRDTLRRAAPVLQRLLDREARGWFLHFRERTAAHLHTQKVPESDIEEEVRLAAMREYVRRVCGAVEASAALGALGAGVPALLADQLRAAAVLERAERRVAARLHASLASHEARLRATHPLLARAGAWRAPRLAAAARRLQRELRWAAREDAAAAMHALRLHQHRYFLLRDLAFLRDREPLLAAELRAATAPTRTFAWPAPAWGPSADPAHEVARARFSSTRWAGWRVCNAAQRARAWAWRALYVLLVVLAWRSPLSARALLRRRPAPPDLELSQVTGTLYPKHSSGTHTMWSRLRALWRHVAKQRARIDAEPDTGLVDGGVTRGLRRLGVACVGASGSLALVVVFPLCVVATCVLALAGACAAPLLAPPAALLHHLFNVLVYDFDCPRPGRLNRWFPLAETLVWRLGVCGVLQPLAALALALAACPGGALALAAAGVAWEAARAAWEAAAWRAVIARKAHVPTHDSVFCRRVRGPGVTARASLQLSPAQAAAAACARVELQALAAWQARTERAIHRPLRDYEHFVDACFGPFSVRIAESGSYRQLQRECAALVGELRGAAAARRRDLACPLSDAARARCRLDAPDLRRARAAAAGEAQRAWRGEACAEEWWGARGLEAGDWPALAADALVDAFHADVLLPLDPAAARLPLDTGTGGGARWWAAQAARAAAPPDVVGAAEAGGAAPRVPPPALDVAAFSPRASSHPPLPSPPMVALLLHNRDSDTPVPLESDLCAEIVRSLEDAPDADADSVERYRGGGSSEGSSSDGEDDEGRRADTSDSRSGESGGLGAGPGGAPAAEAAPAGRGACRWTLTGRGVRLRADLASPEDVTLDAERRGTSV